MLTPTLRVAAIYPKFDVKLIRLERYSGPYGIMTLIAEIGLIAYTLLFLVLEVRRMIRTGKRYVSVSQPYCIPSSIRHP